MSLGNQASRGVLRHIFGKSSAFSSLSTFYITLSTADPGDNGASSAEPSGGGYAAVSSTEADWNDPTNDNPSVMTNSAEIAFPEATAQWSSGSNFTHFAIWSHATNRTASDFVASGSITSPKAIDDGDVARFQAGQLSISLT